MARLEGFEPPTNRIGTCYSIQLSYRRTRKCLQGVIIPILSRHASPIIGGCKLTRCFHYTRLKDEVAAAEPPTHRHIMIIELRRICHLASLV